MNKLTTEEQKLMSYIEGLIPKNGQLEYDFNDPKQYAFAVLMTKKHIDTTRYPGTLKTLELQKESHVSNGSVCVMDVDDLGFQNKFAITGLGTIPGQKNVASNGMGTVVGGYAQMSLLMWIKDNTTGSIIAHGMNNDMAGTLLAACTTPVAHGLNVTAYMQYSATPNGGGTPISGIVPLSAYNAVADPALTQPKHFCTQPYVANAINIGLGRKWTDPTLGVNFDYAWDEQPTSNPIGKIPFVGSATFNQPIQALTPNSNFLLQIYVANDTNGGTTTLNPSDMTHVYSCFSIDANNPNKLNWNLPAGTSTTAPGNPIVFSSITWPTDILAMFYCQIIVTLQDGSFGSANVQSQTIPDTDPLDGTTGILPISFIWHCLGEHTLVTMSNGIKKPIAEIIAGDEVQTGNKGEVAKVSYTNRGNHIGNVLSIQTASGNQIISSHNHVFMTRNGPSPASELRAGDALLLADGRSSKIVHIALIPDYEGMFYNLALHEPHRKHSVGTFVANGFVVGDMESQRACRKALSNNIDWVKKQVPAYLHKDVESFFEDKVSK